MQLVCGECGHQAERHQDYNGCNDFGCECRIKHEPERKPKN